MKLNIIIFTVLILSCGKSKFEEVNSIVTTEYSLAETNEKNNFLRYSEKIDIMVAFLWPEKIEGNKAKELTVSILQKARELKNDNDFLLEMNEDYNSLECDEILIGEIEASAEIEALCYEFSDKKDELTRFLYQKVLSIETSVKLMGGEWLANHRDFDNIPTAEVDLESGLISFSALGSYKTDSIHPISYSSKKINPVYKNDYAKIYFTFERLKWNVITNDFGSYGVYSAELSLFPMKNSLVFQGELDWAYNGKTRKGVIYWQNLLK